MCNDYGLKHPITVINQAFSEVQIPLIFPRGTPNLAAREDIRPTEIAPAVRRPVGGDLGGDGPSEGAAELAELKWGFKPGRPKASPVINFRSEGRSFGAGRCLIPASHFFEFTGAKSPKSKWRFARPDGGLFCVAGLIRPALPLESGGEPAWPESFTMLTTAPGPDIAPIHDRQIVVLAPEQWAAWLDPSVPAAELLRPSSAGTLVVEQVR